MVTFSWSCRMIMTKSWLNITCGFIPRKIQLHIHTGLWSPANWMAQSAHETLYKRHVNINEMARFMWAKWVNTSWGPGPMKIHYFYLFKISDGHILLWGHWYPCCRLLVMFSLDFKARVGSLICRDIHDVHSLRFTSGVTPANLLVSSMAAKPFSSIYTYE